MSIDLKQDVIQAVRKGNCAKYKDNSHACWWCPCAVFENDDYICKNAALDTSEKKIYKVKPRKVKKNPYPKYSYDTALVTENGKSVWGIDNKWLLWEIKHGKGLPDLFGGNK